MPLSRLLGRPVRETTTYVRGVDGLIVSSTTVGEPEWGDDDRGWLLALLAEDADTCSGCGHPNSETSDPASMHQWRLVQRKCWACVVLEADADARAESKTKDRGLKTGIARHAPKE